MLNKQIIFTSRKVPNNSFFMRGEQIAEAMRTIGYPVVCLKPVELHKVRDSLIVWVRRTSGDMRLRSIKKRGNIQIYDPLDRIDELNNKRNRINRYIDAIIYPSKTQLRQSVKDDILNDKLKYHLLHHWDSRLTVYDFNSFELGYWGYRTSAVNVFNFIDKKNRFTAARAGEFPPDDFFKRISCHYSVRDEKRGLGWRPTTKISTAAACGANIILSRDAISEELLPHDYPYFINGAGYEDTQRMIDYAKMTFKADIWNYGLACMKKVRRATSIERCARLYANIIEDINDRLK